MTEFYKEKFNKFYARQMALLKRDHHDKFKIKQRQGGLTATSKEDMDLLVEKFICQIFGPKLLQMHGLDQ